MADLADVANLAADLVRYEPPAVPLLLTRTGRGSRRELVDYVRTVIEQNTTPNADTDPDRLARAIVTSTLSRLGAGYSIASGQAWTELVPSDDAIAGRVDEPALERQIGELRRQAERWRQEAETHGSKAARAAFPRQG